MPFDPIACPENPPFLRSLCKSLYQEPLLVRWPQRALLCKWGMTSQGRIGPLIDENDPEGTRDRTPAPDRMLPPDDAEYAALVRQEDPEANLPWAFAVAAFKYAGGHVPQPPPGADKWVVLHLYDALTRYAVGNQDEAYLAAKHYTQSTNLVAVHPVVQHLMAQYPCIVNVLQRRAFDTFGYDPANQFGEGGHDNCGFV
jgi:hypothetical protein